MAETLSSRVDWYSFSHPWNAEDENLTTEQTDELYMFQKQEGLRLEKEQRRQAFEESILLQRRKFEAEERLIHSDIIYPFMYKLWDEGVEAARRDTIPAYTFTNFRQLPVELQQRIWSMTARSEPPKLRKILSMRYDVSHTNEAYAFKGAASTGSSRIVRENNMWAFEKTPVTLRVCRDSRMVAQRIHTCMRFCGTRQHAQESEAYFNTLYDNFYFAEYPWNEYKILIDILITQNTTRPLQPRVQRDVDRFFKIQHMTVDFHIFAGVPASVWAAFPKLVRLTIGIYPYDVINNREAIPDRDLGFVKPQKGSKYGKRADWVLAAASEALRAVGKEHRHWKMPELEVLVRQTGDEIDDHVEEQWTEDLEEYKQAVALEDSTEQDTENHDGSNISENQDINQDISDEGEEDDDSARLEQADARMKQTISQKEVSQLKHEYHPSRKIVTREFRYGPCETWGDRDMESWVSDSETECGGSYPNRPFVYSHVLGES
ncbi:hypothetical protein ONS95_008914 [Cadophora gregata]|uniref:uncharacterized protein n=1 Tax=Cadophora gregata TaxID=51156 RepID=UPI0026DB8EEC|nr:uncharacterized protein ONS95_008914 [Cadophora gregata]KAK0123924.1 hypothetical protein ONS95_008914 [Cadophora gregata]KAK0130263.1 hypothetical protein ONS96_000786 [Cadophora gregata f. sp. sojae]